MINIRFLKNFFFCLVSLGIGLERCQKIDSKYAMGDRIAIIPNIIPITGEDVEAISD